MKRFFLSVVVLTVLAGCLNADGMFEMSGNIVGDTTGVVVAREINMAELENEIVKLL